MEISSFSPYVSNLLLISPFPPLPPLPLIYLHPVTNINHGCHSDRPQIPRHQSAISMSHMKRGQEYAEYLPWLSLSLKMKAGASAISASTYQHPLSSTGLANVG